MKRLLKWALLICALISLGVYVYGVHGFMLISSDLEGEAVRNTVWSDTDLSPPEKFTRFPLLDISGIALFIFALSLITSLSLSDRPFPSLPARRWTFIILPPILWLLGAVTIVWSSRADTIHMASTGLLRYDEDALLAILLIPLTLIPLLIFWPFSLGGYTSDKGFASIHYDHLNPILGIGLLIHVTLGVISAVMPLEDWAPQFLAGHAINLLWIYYLACLLVGRSRFKAMTQQKRRY